MIKPSMRVTTSRKRWGHIVSFNESSFGSGVDARLVACGAAVTEPAQLTAGICNKKLTINGPVSVNHLYLYRTYSALGPTVSQAAEQFNLRADAYLWASSLDTTAYAKSVRTIEVPPRY